MIYSRWRKHLHPSIELVPLELAGRGARLGEPFYADFDEAVDDLCERIAAHERSGASERLSSIFGHSMGSTLAYEVCRRLAARRRNTPVHLFCSARIAPHADPKRKRIHNLPDDAFREEILRMGATPAGIFEQRTLHDLYMPILRADFRLIERYEYRPDGEALSCDLTVLSGSEDAIADHDLNAWRRHTAGRFRSFRFPGGHFYLLDQTLPVVELINRCLIRELHLSERIFGSERPAGGGASHV